MADIETPSGEVLRAAQELTQYAQDLLDAAWDMFAAAERLAEFWEGGTSETFAAELKRAEECYKQLVELVNVYIDSINIGMRRWYEDDQAVYGPVKAK